MSRTIVTRNRDRSGKATLFALGVVFVKILPPESQELAPLAKIQMLDTIDRLEAMTSVAVDAINMMDPDTFKNAQKDLDTSQEVATMLQKMPGTYRGLLEEGRVRSLPTDYLFNQEILATTRGVLTPWAGDETVVIPWDEKKNRIASLPGQTLESALAHEYVHVCFGPHSLGYMLESYTSKEVSESSWAGIARKHGDVSYIVSDVYLLIDEWSKGERTNLGEPRYIDLARVYGISSDNVTVLFEKSMELAERETHVEARSEISKTWIANAK